MKKRLLALVLILCAIITVFPVPAQAAATYDASAAVSYAANHWNDGIGLCAEFVSNCLKAGDCPTWSASCFSLFNQLSSSDYGTLQQLSINSDGKVSVPAGVTVSPGDPVFIYCAKETDGKPYVHVYLCAGQDSSGYLTGYAHSKAWNGSTIIYKNCAYCGNKVNTAYAFHMNGSEPGSYTVTFDPNGGRVPFATTTVPMGTALSGIPTATRDGYKFCGWTTERIDPEEKGIFFTATVTDGAYTFDEDTTLYAFWEKEQHIPGSYLFYEATHPHLNYFACKNCGEAVTDGTTIVLSDCTQCNHPSGTWSVWYDVVILPSKTETAEREVETRQVKIEGTGTTEYRYVGYATPDGAHEAWCETYLRSLFGAAVLRYSDWSTTRYGMNGEYWTCGYCSGPHTNIHHYDEQGRPRWGEYTLPDGKNYYWEETRTTAEQTKTQYRYRDLPVQSEPNVPSLPNEPTNPNSGTGSEVSAPVTHPSTQTVTIDGKKVEFQMYSLKDAKGNDTNYIKIRDLALALKGTKAQFDVGVVNGVITFSGGKDYMPNGSENKTPYSGQQTYTKNSGNINVNGMLYPIDAFQITYNGGGYTYFQLRDVAQKLNFNVYWKSGVGVILETDKPYTG